MSKNTTSNNAPVNNAPEAKTPKAKKTAETLKAKLPAELLAVENIEILPNSKNNAVHVKIGKVRLFGFSGPVLVVNHEGLLSGIKSEKKAYGFRVEPTSENMLAILANFRKAEAEKQKAESEKSDTPENDKSEKSDSPKKDKNNKKGK